MKANQLFKYRSEIENRLKDLEARNSGLRIHLVQITQSQPGVFGDLFGHAQEESELGTQLDIHTHTLSLMRQLRAALGRIMEGTFGVCTECEEEIDSKRLEVLPAAKACVRCQELQEKSPCRSKAVSRCNPFETSSLEIA